ncbi:MAG: SDR family NAD(P)-dependent oxidoreductase, partial [Acetobacteraceae bacterium]|nr:SDR family NAD(P)-dependent oxidoreductase [Acetobacteraceae bacterium]
MSQTNTPPARRLCLITGASAGLGESFARLYAARGWDLALTARRGDRLRTLAAELEERTGAAVQVVEADLADPAAPKRIVHEAQSGDRTVSALVNNAGYGLSGSFTATAWDDQAKQLQVMIVALCELARLTAPGMAAQGYGRILNVASVAGLLPGTRGDVLYGPLKSFVVKFSQALNLENRKTGVHVTA